MDVNIKRELRPCLITSPNGERQEKGLFHCWNQYSKPIPPSIVRGGHDGGQVSQIYGIVEFESGRVANVELYMITFLDHPFDEYSWEECDK